MGWHGGGLHASLVLHLPPAISRGFAGQRADADITRAGDQSEEGRGAWCSEQRIGTNK
jgi:hypothetical protein